MFQYFMTILYTINVGTNDNSTNLIYMVNYITNMAFVSQH